MRKRGLIVCLVFSMILCSFPVNAFSVAQDETASNNGKILEAKKKYEKAVEDYRLGPAKFLDDRMCEKHKESHSKSGYEKKLAAETKTFVKIHEKVRACYNAFLNDPKKDWREDRWFIFVRSSLWNP